MSDMELAKKERKSFISFIVCVCYSNKSVQRINKYNKNWFKMERTNGRLYYDGFSIVEGYWNKGGTEGKVEGKAGKYKEKGMKRQDLIFPKSVLSQGTWNRNISPFAHAG